LDGVVVGFGVVSLDFREAYKFTVEHSVVNNDFHGRNWENTTSKLIQLARFTL
jgi:hypothetical protein